jgi:hypothetical protein
MIETSRRSEKMSFIKCWKAAGAFDSLKGITHHSYDLYWVQKVVFHSSQGVDSHMDVVLGWAVR